jgi:two-component system heavy metal sensor histidine kinase CusS
MSSKNAPDPAAAPTARRAARASWSLAARLTAWYAGSSFLLVLAATGLLYWGLVRDVDLEDDQTLGDKVRVLRVVLRKWPDDAKAVRQEVEGAWEARRTQVYARVADGEGNALIETPGMDRAMPPAAFPAPAAEPGVGTDFRSPAGRSFRVLAARVGDGATGRTPAVIQVGMDRSQEVELLAEYRKNLWGVLGAALLVCAAAGYQIARRGIRPVRVVTETANRIRPANLGERIAADGLPAELLALADTFNRMLDRLEQSFTRLSRFSADIAHELRTPVNNLRGGIEVALARPRTTDEYRDVLGSSLEECGRLARMIDSLLFLARAEDPRTQVAREGFDVGRELATVCEFYQAAAGEKGVRITAAAPDGLRAELNRALFQRALGNLVANAVDHTPPGGTVTLSADGDDASTTVAVADTGCGIPAAHLPHVFDRFFRADPARPSSAGNVGLGLAIVRSIVELHGGTVRITSEVGRGTRVTMTLPLTHPTGPPT